jgi:glutathione synthase/RimK-type ligase-like ATP-grasp enzyme
MTSMGEDRTAGLLRYGARSQTCDRTVKGRRLRIALVHGLDLAAAEFAEGHDPEAAIDVALHDALRARDVPFERPLWNDRSVDWSVYDIAVVRTVWDYTQDRDAFVAWAARTGAVTTLENPADVLRWNTHKGYLLELEERGAPVVPTAWLGRGDRVDLAELCTARGWDEVVVKPAVGAASEGLVRVGGGPAGQRRAQDLLDALLAVDDVLVQPFRRRIVEGELSLVAVEGRVTHAVRKLPAEGGFRVQGRLGGSYAPEEPSAEAVRLAEWILSALGAPLLFARVDLVTADDGTLELGEVEATEPDLYLEHSEQGTMALVDAILRRAAGSEHAGDDTGDATEST